MAKAEIMREIVESYEQVIEAATEAAQRGAIRRGDIWGPREIVAHLAGWEMMATVRIPYIVAGMAPLEESDHVRQDAMNDAINTTMITMIGEQSLDTVCGILRQAYQRDIEMLKRLDEKLFQPGEYVYKRSQSAIDHCQEHIETLQGA